MIDEKVDIDGVISEDVKDHWDDFIKNKYGLIDTNGPEFDRVDSVELELAMMNHMKNNQSHKFIYRELEDAHNLELELAMMNHMRNSKSIKDD